MGNVQASNQAVPSSKLISSVGEPDNGSQSLNMDNIIAEDLLPNNPGTMEEIHKKCKDVYPAIFEGGKFMINKPLSNHFQVSHTINFATIQPPGYKFGATYVGQQQISPSESYPVLMAEIDPSGNLHANIIHQLLPSIKTRFVAQIQQSKWQATQLTADWRGKDFTGSITLGNIDLVRGSGVAVAHYIQKVSPKVDLGTEVAYQYGSQVPGGHIAVHTVAARYNGDNFTASGTLGGSGAHLCYYQKASDTVQFGVELETSLRLQESTASMAYQAEIPKANFTFRGTLDSNWTVGAVLEKKLMPLPFTFALSTALNHPKNQFKIGCGFIVG